MPTTLRALALALIAPLAAFAELPQLPDLEADVKRVKELPADQQPAELVRHMSVVLTRASAVPEIKAEGRQFRVAVAPPGPGGAVYYEFEYFSKDRTIRIKTLDKDKGALAKVWWPCGFEDMVFTVKDGRELRCAIAPSPDKAKALEAVVKPPALNVPNAAH